jgi:hypothetical protein
LELLKNFVRESEKNNALGQVQYNLSKLLQAGTTTWSCGLSDHFVLTKLAQLSYCALHVDFNIHSRHSFGIIFALPGTLVVAGLTDPMMSADEACGVFQVLLEQFRGAVMPGVGKVIAFDEAHKYLSHKGPGCTELSQVR